MKTLIVLPAYNEAEVLSETLEGLMSVAAGRVLVVDDGSGDGTAEIATNAGAIVVRHMINLGLGAALETGLEYARMGGYDRVVTFDADGQHTPADISRLLKALDRGDIAIGVRQLHRERMPTVKKVGNFLLNLLTAAFFGVYSRDSQCGLRAFNRTALGTVRLRANGYEVSSEILYEAAKNGLRIVEVPIEAIYTEHSKKRGTGISDGFWILWRMMLHRRVG